MPGQGVVPAIRVRDMTAGLAFYVDRLGFTLERGGPTDDNSAIARDDARMMLEVADAIRVGIMDGSDGP